MSLNALLTINPLYICNKMATVIPATLESPDKKGNGKGLAWNDQEQLALARAATIACQDPTVGAQMSMTQLGRKIRASFIKDEARPAQACTTTKDGGAFDQRRWDGRSAEACLKMWKRLRKACTKFKAIYTRIENLQLTGNPTEEELWRCASLEFSEGTQMLGHLYDCVRNPRYLIRKPFSFGHAYVFLDKCTKFISAGPMQVGTVEGSDGEDTPVKRPIGTKIAKLGRGEEGISGTCKPVKESVADLAQTMGLLQKTINKRQEAKEKAEARRLDFERQRFWYEQANAMFGPGSSASATEKERAVGLMRKRVLESLTAMDADQRKERESTESATVGDVEVDTAGELTVTESTPRTSSSVQLTEDKETQPPEVVVPETEEFTGPPYANTPFHACTEEYDD